MKKLIYFLVVVLICLNTTSCQDDFLEKEPLDRFPAETVWTEPGLIQTFVNDIYAGIPHGFSNIMMASLVDETMYNADFETSNVTRSLITPSNLIMFDQGFWVGNRMRYMSWDHIYKNIRACNLFFEKIEDAPFEDEALRSRMKGEVHFLRAFHYFNLVSLHGGVPLITKAYDLGEDYLVERNSFEDCINLIVSECDLAASTLPLNYEEDLDNKGRATKGAALALKSRVLLHAASDLFNNQSWAGGFGKPELIGYVGGNQTERWQAARDAAKAVMDLGQYSLHKPDPIDKEAAIQAYSEVFLLKETSEDIFIRYFTARSGEDWHGYNPGLYNAPNGYHGWGSNTPIGQLVDDYEMQDGTRFDWSNPEHAANPYENRDPRFYASILYNGAKWRKRPADVVANDPIGVIQTGFTERWNASTGKVEEVPGLDTRKSPIEDWNGSYTGYYMRKFIDPNVNAQYVTQDLPWRFFRYTEILLNYAEASLELGLEEDARQILNDVRKRAGMPPIEASVSGAELEEVYQHERRIELAFEDHRFFDVRRWMISAQAYQNAEGVDIRYKLNPDNTTSVNPTYKVIEIQNREWNPRFYLLPIKLDEMNRNNKLTQNPLYK